MPTNTEQTDPTFSSAIPPAGAEGIRESLRGKHVCPFCGSVNDSEQGTCPRCTMENSSATRKATKTRIGPWYVLQTRNPAAPGMTWETLVGFVRKGRVKPRSIVRGPTTHQLWRFAAHVKGLSREFGICYSCGTNVEPAVTVCPTCNRLQDPPPNPDALLEASRDAQQPLSAGGTVDGAVGAPPQTIVGTVSQAAPAPDNGEFVIPAFGSAGGQGFSVAPMTMSGQAAPAGNAPYQGISGDPTWTRIGAVPEKLRGTQPAGLPNAGGAGNGPAGRPNRAPRNAPPSQNAPQFNPYADEDLPPGAQPGRRNEGGDGGGFLSAKDLAAAFNLSFVGEDEEAPVQQTVRPGRGGQPQPQQQPPAARNGSGRPRQQPAVVPPGNLAADPAVLAASLSGAAPQNIPGYGGVHKPKRGWGKIILGLLFLGAAGFGVALAVNEELRTKTTVWVKQTIASFNKQSENDQLGSPGSKNSKIEGSPSKEGGTKKPVRDPYEPPEDFNNPATAPGASSGTDPAVPASAVTPGSPTPAGGAANAGEANTPNGTNTPAGANTPTPPAPSPGNSGSASADPGTPATKPAGGRTTWAGSEAFRLYQEGVRLESTDPAMALVQYKKIKELPKENWPSDLEPRIKRTEEKLKKMVQ